jgi:hypothetical protein
MPSAKKKSDVSALRVVERLMRPTLIARKLLSTWEIIFNIRPSAM